MKTRYFFHAGLGILWFGQQLEEPKVPTPEELSEAFRIRRDPVSDRASTESCSFNPSRKTSRTKPVRCKNKSKKKRYWKH